MTYRLQDLIDIQHFQNLQDRLNRICSFPSSIIDNDGKILTATAWQDICMRFHRKNRDSERLCIQSDQYIRDHLHEADPAVSYRCPHGLVDNALPIIIDGVHYGSFFTGQFFLEKPDLDFFRAQAKQYGFEEKTYLDAVRRVPIWAREQLDNYLFFIKEMIGVISDSGLKRLNEIENRKKIEKSEKKFSQMFRLSPNATSLARVSDGTILEINDGFTRMFGYPPDEAKGKTTSELDIWKPAAERERVIDKLLMDGKLEREKTRCRTRSGDTLDAQISAVIIETKHEKLIVAEVMDVTKEKENQRLEQQLRQAQKMESIGRLAGGVAHDFNNMLSVIIGRAEMALEEIGPDQPLYRSLKEIKIAGERSADLTRQLLAFARKQTVAPRVLDLNKTLAGMLTMLQRLLGEDIELAWIPGEKVWPVKVDPGQINQILANLCVNARDAIDDVGKITIESGVACFDEDYCADHVGFRPGDYALIAVSDNGSGMDAETQKRLFEPFFTTKEAGKGTGLGLATVYGAVKQNRGFINVYSEPGQGTAIRIYLPRHLSTAASRLKQEQVQPVKRGQETILLVEDEPTILRMATMMLEKMGYTVVAARTPGEAQRLAHEYDGELHLLITDVVMPEMNGRDLARRLTFFYPRLKKLFMSGYTANVIAHHGVLDEGVNFIPKPFSKEDLSAKIRQTLDRKI